MDLHAGCLAHVLVHQPGAQGVTVWQASVLELWTQDRSKSATDAMQRPCAMAAALQVLAETLGACTSSCSGGILVQAATGFCM